MHLDLQRAGVIIDPYFRLAERGAAWVDEVDWVYETTFHLEEPVAADTMLVFHGLDTVAEIALNGELIGTTDNMFIPHEFPVGSRLKVGELDEGANTLRVVLRSAARVGRERHRQWDGDGSDTLQPNNSLWGPRAFVRKAQYMYGWDWGPELISCGIWRPVEIVQIPVAQLRDYRCEVSFTSDGKAVIDIQAFVERAPSAGELPLTFSASITDAPKAKITWAESDDRRSALREEDPQEPAVVFCAAAPVPTAVGRVGVKVTITIDHPRRWWPNGQTGITENPARWFKEFAPYLYPLEMAIHTENKGLVDHKKSRIGLRTVQLIREPDPDGTGESFKFRVNDLDLFIKGANWIPVDSFPGRVPSDAGECRKGVISPEALKMAERLKSLLTAAARANFNMLRVWGGGLYESELFYDLCDELGLLVWQDFPYACGYYPDTGLYAAAAQEEAVSAVRRLRAHPSLALWCGNNENHQMHYDGWGGDNRPPRYLGEKIYHEVLPGVIASEDPGRPYWPSSPFGGDSPQSPDYGDRHNWDVWHGQGDWAHYTSDQSRFVSEFGFASSCGMDSWDACLGDGDRWARSPAVRWHDKTRKGYDTYLGYVGIHFPDPQTLEDLVYYSQINQAEALKCGIEHYRRNKGRCWGLLFWQLNDCWPVQSWSVIDSACEPKAAYHAVQEACAPVLLSLHRTGDNVEAHLTNDLNTPLSGTITLALVEFNGKEIGSESAPATVGANAAAHVLNMSLERALGRERESYVEARFKPDEETEATACDFAHGFANNMMFLAEPKDLQVQRSGLKVDVRDAGEDGFLVWLEAERLAPYVWLRIHDDIAAPHEWGDNFMHVRPTGFRFVQVPRTAKLRSAADVRSALKLRTL